MATIGSLDIEDSDQLLCYLRQSRRIEPSDLPCFTTLQGGVSNRTVWVQHQRQDDWVVKQALDKLRVQVDWFSDPERIQREAAGLRWLGEIIPDHVPQFIFADENEHILAMSAVPHPHQNWKSLLLQGKTSIPFARKFGELLALIHNAVFHHEELSGVFADRRFFEELRLEPYYSYPMSQVPKARAFLEQLVADTRRRRLALVHGDYSPKNVLIHRNSLVLLDFEVIHFGDPAFDIGFAMTHFLSKAHFLFKYRESFLAKAHAIWHEYMATLRGELADRMEPSSVRHTLACLLARVAGRSPLEYLGVEHRCRQQQIVLDLIPQDLATIPELIDAFQERLGFQYE